MLGLWAHSRCSLSCLQPINNYPLGRRAAYWSWPREAAPVAPTAAFPLRRSPRPFWYNGTIPSALRIPDQSDRDDGGREKGHTSRGEMVVQLLDFVRKRRSQIRRALQPAPAEVEEALLRTDRDIKARLHEEIAAAQQSGQGPWPRVKQANMEAAHAFKPILEATQQLAQALAGNAKITFTMRDSDVE